MPLAVDDDDGDLALTLGQRVAGPEISTQRPHHLRKPGVVHPDLVRPAERTAGLDQRAISLLLRRRAKLRQQGQQIPIIMLTGSDAKTDVVRGPDSGANDYIAKPFRLNELLARLRAQVRAFEDSADAVFVIGPYTFRPSAKLLEDAARDQRIRLTEKEAGILKFLYRAGAPVGRQVLLNEVWGYNAAVDTHTLETHIYRLRQKIEPDPANARLLVTVAAAVSWFLKACIGRDILGPLRRWVGCSWPPDARWIAPVGSLRDPASTPPQPSLRRAVQRVPSIMKQPDPVQHGQNDRRGTSRALVISTMMAAPTSSGRMTMAQSRPSPTCKQRPRRSPVAR